MRDIAITMVVFGLIPYMLRKPHIGILLWCWIGYMNPHRAAYGFAESFPFALVIAAATLIGLVFSKEPRKISWTSPIVVLVIYVIWITITTAFALSSEEAWLVWNKVMKIQLMTFVALMLINSRERIDWLLWVIVVSIGFYGVKGGIFTITSGGNHMVLGPNRGFISGNTEIGLAMIMVLPLMAYLWMNAKNIWVVRDIWVARGLMVAMVLVAAAIIGTHSRGALLGIMAMGLFLWLKSRRKFVLMLVMVVFVPVMMQVMPDHWFNKMNTIQTYEEDSSAMGRIEAWRFATNLAMARPIVGAGYEAFSPQIWAEYTPDPGSQSRAAHSIYFQTLGEHGFVGLGLFILLMVLTWRLGSWTIRNTKGRQDLKWAGDMASMIQVSLIGYAVAGAFLTLANFDFFYHLIAIMSVLSAVVKTKLEEDQEEQKVG